MMLGLFLALPITGREVGERRAKAQPLAGWPAEAREELAHATLQICEPPRVGRRRQAAELDGAGDAKPPCHRRHVETEVDRADGPVDGRIVHRELQVIAALGFERDGVARLPGERLRPGSRGNHDVGCLQAKAPGRSGVSCGRRSPAGSHAPAEPRRPAPLPLREGPASTRPDRSRALLRGSRGRDQSLRAGPVPRPQPRPASAPPGECRARRGAPAPRRRRRSRFRDGRDRGSRSSAADR